MNNQRGEVVTGVMVVMMVGMMIFGMVFMHGGHRDNNDYHKTEHPQEHSDAGPHHMHDSDAEKTRQPDNQEGE